jgi:hypothetical protein
MTDDKADHVFICSGPADLIEMTAVLLESKGFLVSTQPAADGGTALLTSRRDAEDVRLLLSKWQRQWGM